MPDPEPGGETSSTCRPITSWKRETQGERINAMIQKFEDGGDKRVTRTLPARQKARKLRSDASQQTKLVPVLTRQQGVFKHGKQEITNKLQLGFLGTKGSIKKGDYKGCGTKLTDQFEPDQAKTNTTKSTTKEGLKWGPVDSPGTQRCSERSLEIGYQRE